MFSGKRKEEKWKNKIKNYYMFLGAKRKEEK
jgi:hypothetical protein